MLKEEMPYQTQAARHPRNGHGRPPLQVELQVAQDGAVGQERAAHAREQVPVGTVSGAVGLGDVIGLFDQLTVDLIAQFSQVLAGLQDSLDDGHGIRHDLHFLQGIEDLHGLVL